MWSKSEVELIDKGPRCRVVYSLGLQVDLPGGVCRTRGHKFTYCNLITVDVIAIIRSLTKATPTNCTGNYGGCRKCSASSFRASFSDYSSPGAVKNH